MFSVDHFPSTTESQDENLFAAHYEHTDLAQFSVDGLGIFSIGPVSSALQLSVSNDSSNRSIVFSSPPTLSKDPNVCNVFAHLFKDLDVLEVLKSCDLSSMFSKYVAVTSPSTLRASSSDNLRGYFTRIERLLSDIPMPMRGRFVAPLSFVSGAFFSLVRLMTVLTRSSRWVSEQTRLPRATRL